VRSLWFTESETIVDGGGRTRETDEQRLKAGNYSELLGLTDDISNDDIWACSDNDTSIYHWSDDGTLLSVWNMDAISNNTGSVHLLPGGIGTDQINHLL
jgi:hypothetical protein